MEKLKISFIGDPFVISLVITILRLFFSGLRRFAANCMWLAIVFATIMTITTTLFCRTILEWMKTPEDIIKEAHAYIWVIFLGIPVKLIAKTHPTDQIFFVRQ